MIPGQAADGLAKAQDGPAEADPALAPDRRSRLAEAALLYANRVRACYPREAGNDPLTLGVNQIADVLEQKAMTTAPMAFRLWVTQYAQALFWAHPDRNDPYSVGVCAIAGDLEVALLAWGDPDAPADDFQDVADDTFGLSGRDPR
jgi:hypothetical protein